MSQAQETCAAYGCPMLGSFGASGQWYCVCHFRADASAHNPITAVLNQHRALADQAVYARRSFAGYKAIKQLEDELINLTHDIGKQYAMQGVTK